MIGVFYFRSSRASLPSISSVYADWNNQDYESVYKNTSLILNKRPLDGEALALNGFAAYYMYVGQTEPSAAYMYLDSSITNLRKAWYRVSDTEKPQISYILGKAYYHRGHYYSDLAMKYLDYADSAGLQYDDLQEFRGLAAAQLGEYEIAIDAFTEALAKKPSDLLLYTIAQNYNNIGDIEKSKQYLLETIRTTNDEVLQLKCRYMLGEILFFEGDIEDAKKEFDLILEKDENSADAHYGLGVIYENQGDLVRARAEWRRAIRLNPVHPGARQKLNL
ncbi:tetratricopeptide repeat protein [Brucepastera parasyntrophica]|uniref:tetratricopeptide repeat protein n=1 Tax=Brucepastera parasyntrophica TaxID=2880008 RepID=UPI00210DC26E|nr:tetratricopeptide repeat protein [Brucepastera parasyntrophica]ULQ59987.1 tetratricopeptide repeat protein [Brucepastera parasyntrophica]